MRRSSVSGGILLLFLLFPLIVFASFHVPQDPSTDDANIGHGTHDLDHLAAIDPLLLVHLEPRGLASARPRNLSDPALLFEPRTHARVTHVSVMLCTLSSILSTWQRGSSPNRRQSSRP